MAKKSDGERERERETFVGKLTLHRSISLTPRGLKYHLDMASTYLSVRAKYPVNDLIYRFASFTYYNIARGVRCVPT